MVFNELNNTTVAVASGVVKIVGLPAFKAADVSATGCSRTCPAACVKGKVRVTPTAPAAGPNCEGCNPQWELRVIWNPCLKTYRTWETFAHTETYNYVQRDGGTPAVSPILENIALQINNNPDSVVTATLVGTAGNYTAVDLEERDCNGENGSCGFTAHVSLGSVSVTTAHKDPVLSASEIAREFPNTHMNFMGVPPASGNKYCVYNFRVFPVYDNDDTMPNSKVERYIDVEIWVNNQLANFLTDFDTPLATALTCLGAPLT